MTTFCFRCAKLSGVIKELEPEISGLDVMTYAKEGGVVVLARLDCGHSKSIVRRSIRREAS